MAGELYLNKTCLKEDGQSVSTLCLPHLHFLLTPLRFSGMLVLQVPFISTSAMNETNWCNQLGYIWVMWLGEKSRK